MCISFPRDHNLANPRATVLMSRGSAFDLFRHGNTM
jgi:hypothetical protein